MWSASCKQNNETGSIYSTYFKSRREFFWIVFLICCYCCSMCSACRLVERLKSKFFSQVTSTEIESQVYIILAELTINFRDLLRTLSMKVCASKLAWCLFIDSWFPSANKHIKVHIFLDIFSRDHLPAFNWFSCLQKLWSDVDDVSILLCGQQASIYLTDVKFHDNDHANRQLYLFCIQHVNWNERKTT